MRKSPNKLVKSWNIACTGGQRFNASECISTSQGPNTMHSGKKIRDPQGREDQVHACQCHVQPEKAFYAVNVVCLAGGSMAACQPVTQ